MQFLIRSRLSGGERPNTEAEGRALIEDYILPTLKRCIELQKEQRIIAGGPEVGAIALSLILEAPSAQELDSLITSLPLWPRMETSVTPLTTFEDRQRSVDAVLAMLESRTHTQKTVDALR